VELEDEKEALNIHNWGAWVLRKRAWGQSKVSWSQVQLLFCMCSWGHRLGRNLQLNGEFHELVQPYPNGWMSHKKLNALDYIKLTHTNINANLLLFIYLLLIWHK
jgi:hypothetical protein